MARWLRQADAIRAARERGWGDEAVEEAGERRGRLSRRENTAGEAVTDYLVLGVGGVLLVATGLTVGWAVGQGMCRRHVRRHLGALFAQLDTEPQFAPMRWDVLNLIKRLEL